MSIFQDAELAAAKQQAEEEAIALVALKKRKEDMAARKRKKQKKVASRASVCPKMKPSKELGGREAFASLDLYNKNVPNVKYDGDSQTFVKLMKDGKKVEGARYKEASAISEQDRFLVGIVKGAERIHKAAFNGFTDSEDPEGTNIGTATSPVATAQSNFGTGIFNSLGLNHVIPSIRNTASSMQQGVQRGIQGARNYVQPYVQQATQTIKPLVQQYQDATSTSWKPPSWYGKPGGLHGLNTAYASKHPTSNIAANAAATAATAANARKSTDQIGDYHQGLQSRWGAGRGLDMSNYNLMEKVRSGDAAAQQEFTGIQNDARQRQRAYDQARQNPQYHADLAAQQQPGSVGAQYFANKAKNMAGQAGTTLQPGDPNALKGTLASAPSATSAAPNGRFGNAPHFYSPGGKFNHLREPDRYDKYIS